MAGETTTIPLIRTKLQRPPIIGEHVHRSQLLERLDQRRQRPLTLVTAPAGYGKSTLVSCWLEACGFPAAWLSLDETDNDLHLFLSYLLAEIDRILGEIAAIQGGLLFWVTDGVGAVEKSQRALESTPKEHECVRSAALMH